MCPPTPEPSPSPRASSRPVATISPMTPNSFPLLIQRFFAEHLLAQRNLSVHTVAAYRDTFRLLLGFLAQHSRRPVDQLTLTALTPDAILAFLDQLETKRRNTVRTRNARLAAIRSFARYALAVAAPEFLAAGHRIMAVPFKRGPKPLLGFMTRDEMTALLAAIDIAGWCGRRDRLLFTLLYHTGARVSEALHVRAADVDGRVLALHGKGRKERTVPLAPETHRQLRRWVQDNALRADQPLFANARGAPLTRAGVGFRLAHWLRKAAATCPTLGRRKITPHTFRHSTAMHLLQSGVAVEVIALWLGHDNPATTHLYVEADLKMKQDCLARLEKPSPTPRRRAQYSRVLAFLEAL